VVNVAISEVAESHPDTQASPGPLLRKRVETARNRWQATLEQARRDDAQVKAMTSEGRLRDEFLVGFQAQVVFRRLYRRYLRRRFRYDLRRRRWLRGARLPESHLEANLLADASMAYGVYNGAFCRCLQAIYLAVIDEKDTDGQLADAVAAMQHLSNSQLLFHGAVMDSPYDHQREAATILLSGWMATQVSLNQNQRLKKSLLQESDAAHAKLLERLPAHVYTSWSERVPGEDFATMRNRVVRRIEREGANQKASLSQLPPDAAPKGPLAENFLQQLEAQDEFMAWLRRAELTPLEEAVTIRKLGDFTEQEIADALGRSVGSVKQAWLRARGKLEGSAPR
jgi:hypothetical protein